jgi:hypothetical protein
LTKRVVIVLSILTLLLVSTASIAQQSPVSASLKLAQQTVIEPRGQRQCFNIGSENCCFEIAFVGIWGSLVNPLAGAFAGTYLLLNCTSMV